MANENCVTLLEVAIDDELLEMLTQAAHHRGQSMSEFVESVLRREVQTAMAEEPAPMVEDEE